MIFETDELNKFPYWFTTTVQHSYLIWIKVENRNARTYLIHLNSRDKRNKFEFEFHFIHFFSPFYYLLYLLRVLNDPLFSNGLKSHSENFERDFWIWFILLSRLSRGFCLVISFFFFFFFFKPQIIVWVNRIHVIQ